MKRILILNKIKHKPIIIEKIFPYALKRPILFPYLINNDIILKLCLKNTYKSLKKNNNLSKEINDIYYKFIFCRLLYETDFNESITNIEYITKYIKENKLYNYNNYTFYTILFYHIFINKHKDKKFLFNQTVFNNFIIDYFQLNKKIVLFIAGYNNKDNINFINTLKSIKDIEINLIIFLKNDNCTDIKDLLNEINNYLKINKVKYIIESYISYNQSFYSLLLCVNNNNYIKEIIFDETFSKYNNHFLELLSYDINNNKKYDTLKSVEKIIYDEPNYLKKDAYKKIFVRYSINNFFSSKAWCNLVIIKPDDFNNIKNFNNEEIDILTSKINKFEEDENKEVESKILYIDFENNSPFQENFIYFWNKYLNYNECFDTIYFTNIGKINYSQIWYEEIKNNKIYANYFSNLVNIYYLNKDKKISGEIYGNDIKEFINLFFCLGKSSFLHEVYFDKELAYFYCTDKLDISYIKTNIKNKNLSIKIYNDNIEIGYDYNRTFKIKQNNDILEKKTIIQIYNLIKDIYSSISKIKRFDIKTEDLMKINLLNNYNSEILKNKKQYETIFKGFNKIFFVNKVLLLTKNDYVEKLDYIFQRNKLQKLLLIIETNDGYIFGACSNFNNNFKRKRLINNFVFDVTNDKIFTCRFGWYSSSKSFGIDNYFHVSSDITNSSIFLSLSSLCLKDLKLTIENKLIDTKTLSKSLVERKINKLEVYEVSYNPWNFN